MKLKDLAKVMPGYAFRGAIEADFQGDTLVLQARDISRDGFLAEVSHLTPISRKQTGRAEVLCKNDVLLVSRGLKSGSFRATLFMSDASNVIASSSVHILRVKTEKMLPEYLVYYLNSKGGQDALSQIVSGSYIGVLSRGRLSEELDIPLPSLRQQKLLIDLVSNIRRQEEVLERQKVLRQGIVDEVFKKITA